MNMTSYTTNFDHVKTFMKTFGQDVKDSPELPDKETISLRIELIAEELNELWDACENKDLVEIADALTDILYVTYGAGHAFGLDLDACFREVQRSNMSKLGEDGKPIYREDGKVLKGPDYSEPDLKKTLQL
jgi:predicted HAD superfamily Cof-like phosphohydrolase|tara:strand:- start:567 stop:959 length:393 start_codon:yes stop_codon:yes gene_type:complete